MSYSNFITSLLSERQSDLDFQTFVRSALVALQSSIRERFDALSATLEKIVSGQSSAGDFETEHNEDLAERLTAEEHPKVFLAQRAKARLPIMKTTNFYKNYHRFLFTLPSYPGVKFTVKFGKMEKAQVADKASGQYDVKYEKGRLLRNRYDQVITVDQNTENFEGNFADLFETYQYLTYVRIYFPDDLLEEREDYYDDIISLAKYSLVSILDEVKIRNILYHEFRHAYDMMKIGTEVFRDQRVDDETGNVEFKLPSEKELETIRQSFVAKDFKTMDDRKIGYFMSNHERNAFTTGVLSSLHEFLDSNYRPGKTPREMLFRFLSNFPHNRETMVIRDIADSTGDFKRFMGRLWTFVADYIKTKDHK